MGTSSQSYQKQLELFAITMWQKKLLVKTTTDLTAFALKVFHHMSPENEYVQKKVEGNI